MNLGIPQAILSERQRQIDKEGWSAEHDDQHDGGSLLDAARCYFKHATGAPLSMRDVVRPAYVILAPRRIHVSARLISVPSDWPWGAEWWKPKNAKRDLERAGGLCLAEIGRLDRKARTDDDAIRVMATQDLIEQIVAAYNG